MRAGGVKLEPVGNFDTDPFEQKKNGEAPSCDFCDNPACGGYQDIVEVRYIGQPNCKEWVGMGMHMICWDHYRLSVIYLWGDAIPDEYQARVDQWYIDNERVKGNEYPFI